MASFLAHGATGYATARALGVRGWPLAGYALLAWAPDLDMLAGFLLAGDWHAYHRAWWSHSPAVSLFGAAAALALHAAQAMLPGRAFAARAAARSALVVALVLLTHVVVDYVLVNPAAPALQSETARAIPSIARALLVLLSDALFYGAVVLAAWIVFSRLRGAPVTPRDLLRSIRP